MKKIVFLIRSLNVGGAERQLLTLIQSLDRKRFDPVVITFYADGNLIPEFTHHSIPIISAAKKSRWDVIPFLHRLVKILNIEKPDLIVSYLVAANILAITLKPLLGRVKIAISIRHSFLRKEDYDWLSSILYFLEDRLANWADLIVLNSFVGAKLAQQRGISPEKMVVIPNGIDTNLFHQDDVLRSRQREKMNLKKESFVVGMIGRLDPVKDHFGFIKSASRLRDAHPNARFVIVGDGPDEYRHLLEQEIDQNSMGGRIFIFPAEINPLAIYNALDLCVSFSKGEGFSNVIAEAMSCEIPCVVSDVGDSASIVGDTGKIVPAGDIQKLSQAMREMTEMQPVELNALGKLARQRIVTEFSVEKMVSSTENELEKLG